MRNWRAARIMVLFWSLLWVGLSPLVFGLPAWGTGPVVFYVSPEGDDGNPGTEAAPFRSIGRAQAAVRPLTESMTSDITVYLRGGTYALHDTVRFDHRDSGENGFQVIYRSVPQERAVLSGGRVVSGWNRVGNGLYRASYGNRGFRQFYVNGVRGIRAREPNEPDFARLVRWDEANQQILLPPGVPSVEEDLGFVEMVILKQWTQDNVRLASMTDGPEGVVVVPREPDRTKTFTGHLALRYENESYVLENALALVDAPGEWYHRPATGVVWYRPRAGEDLDRATVIVPVLERLIEVRGTPRDPVHHLTLMGLGFEYAAWLLPSDEGFATLQADVTFAGGPEFRTERVGAAVYVEHAHHLGVERNAFRHLGATALAVHTGVSDLRVVGNRFEDLSGSGIVVDGQLEPRFLDPRFPCQDILIANNLIERIGLDYRSSVGIFAGYVANVTIEHNEIRHAPYTGISVGWGWTDTDTILRQNRIQWNHISAVVTAMADGAGIYTLSKQPGTIIHGNYVHDLVRSPWAGHSPIAGLYLDEGSSGIEVSDNVLERVPLGIFFHRATHNRVVNTEGSYLEQNGAMDNVFRQEPGFSAERVKATAGLEPAFADLRTKP